MFILYFKPVCSDTFLLGLFILPTLIIAFKMGLWWIYPLFLCFHKDSHIQTLSECKGDLMICSWWYKFQQLCIPQISVFEFPPFHCTTKRQYHYYLFRVLCLHCKGSWVGKHMQTSFNDFMRLLLVYDENPLQCLVWLLALRQVIAFLLSICALHSSKNM